MGQEGVGSKSNVPVYERRPKRQAWKGRDRYSSERDSPSPGKQGNNVVPNFD